MEKYQAVVKKFLTAQDSLVVQASDLSLETIASMVNRHSIDIEPKYQRRQRWSEEKQSALIESFILNIPVPPVYLAEEEYGRYSVIDGKQRVTAITNFLNDTLKLRGLETFRELEGATFSELPAEIRNALSIRPYVRVVTLLKQSDPELKYQVFIRLNRGGELLNAQEIRNVAFRGPLNDLIFELSSDEFLKSQLKITNDRSTAYVNMTDVEYVLRFLTLTEVWRKFSGSLLNSMDEFMRRHQRASDNELKTYRILFGHSLSGCKAIWGNRAFKRTVRGEWRDLAIAGMYDAQMIAVSEFSTDVVERLALRSEEIIEATKRLMEEDEDLEVAITQGTNTPSRVFYRVSAIYSLLQKFT